METSNTVRAKENFKNVKKPACFDSDSYLIGIDNHSSKSISNKQSDFVGSIRPCNGVLNGIGGRLKIKGKGTIRWSILDDDGHKHSIKIHDCLYVPDAAIRLLSPQQWSQQSSDHFAIANGTWCATYHDKCVLHWQQNKFQKTVRLDKSTNVAAQLQNVPSTHPL